MKLTLQRTAALALVVTSLAGLSGCFPLLVGGAVMGGLVATDRRTSGSVVEDEGIELRASSRVDENLGKRVHVDIISYNRQVLITGEVPSAQDKQLVGKIVSGVDNVRSIVNDLAIMGNVNLSQISSDALVTAHVKANLVDARDLFSNAFKISTVRGTTYVLGRVTQREANRVTEVVSSTPGVQKVVRIFEIISEEELARMLPPPAEPAKK